ncbi:short-chain dehydrogenase/reductase SDR [Thermoclostridium stercorarium subsp. stercorarium DSM 8532]|jgi:NAD(P)-dependent dehydrogenase (short-subunit alcohol dehydrogenase family)|uniref:Short-chain dehydrogenase/reductase SDR n=3 Tax=Thermoclostridium stercorarium TaxID=1510 RepID=L7VQQ9_THES1|nr:SDR family oxidoreductase [Thermoclostridium stercorarium]AGC68731.1 short-chain dehydrogenase/reductase SDR [Thermoclostridium stercorarium subsp. stercorarium DSM 8532]AGI39739.1 alcohol dehydrogenase [Thermoclostridium stercorarium subsp. stercorarium DSM 8532]ANW99062.1 short-chain dehydrogenase [Thermoclostridium stercorarium subsp. thermolacticum DSM 2910]ANX01590.1 short-chain dehydrogenase [Thermoclostridium stercorarium subsp. leptospartum DSM 9219]UZQ84708.1 SDR family oxidoreduct
MSGRFSGKVAVVTGGALGIGRCLTQEFAKEGARVAFVDMNKRAGEENVEIINGMGGKAYFFYGDIAEEKVLKEFADEVVKRFGKVDFLINNACVSRKGILEPCGYEDFNYVLRVGVTAPYYLTLLFLPHFTDMASVVNIASTRAFMSQRNTESYTAAKGGIIALTHAMAVSLSGRVRVNSVSPGWIDTGKYHDVNYVPEYSKADLIQHPSGRIGTPMDIVRAVFYLCDPENTFVNGENITVDGGMTKLMIYTGDEGWTLNVD